MKRILVALDTSPRAAEILAAAVDLARQTGGSLVLYRAVSLPAEMPAFAYSQAPADIEKLLLEHAEDGIAAMEATLPPELRGGRRTSLAVPWQGICEAAGQEHADLIIVGSHGYRGLDRLLGTTAAKVVNHANVSVLVVKPA